MVPPNWADVGWGIPCFYLVSALRWMTLDLEGLGMDTPILELSGWSNP